MRYLPQSVQAFLARRLVDVYAACLFLGGLFLFLSLSTYSHSDPSWNTAAGEAVPVQNIMGGAGAWASDFLLQTFGIGSFLFALGLCVWGMRHYMRQKVRPFSLRVVVLILSALCVSIAMAQVPSGEWAVHPYLGSTLGAFLLDKIQSLSPQVAQFGIPAISGFVAFGVALFALAVSKKEIIWTISACRFVVVGSASFVLSFITGFMGWISHHNKPGYVPQWPSVISFADIRGFFADISQAISAREQNAQNPIEQARPAVAKPEQVERSFAEERMPEISAPQMSAHNAQASIPVVKAATSNNNKIDQGEQPRFSLPDGDWELPSLALIEEIPADALEDTVSEETLQANAELLQTVLADFKIEGEIVSIHPGPVVTLYELEPAPGTKSSRVISLADDIARSMSAISVRVAVVPGRNVIGIELPNKVRQTVYMRELLATRIFEKTKAKLPLILGKDISGQPILADLAKMPHLLVAGTTGSGKSVGINTMIMSLLYRLPPEKCRFIMIDPKMLELSIYDDIPHLLSPVVTEPGEAIVALKWTVSEMEERYRAMSKMGVRNIEGYNKRVAAAAKSGEVITRKVQTGFDADTGKPVYEEQPIDLTELPYIVVVVDEFADLMLVAGKDVEGAIQRLAQMARAAGIHLIMATQRPSVDVITGVIKANFPTRISFSVTSKVDSRTILGEGGAEQLLGMGDMLYMAPGGRITRVHGPFTSDKDVEGVTNFLRSQSDPLYIEDIASGGGDFGDNAVLNAMFGDGDSGSDSVDELYDKAVALVAREGKASTSFVQRYLQIGYNRAARIIEEMERQGIISAATKTGKREILVRDFSDV